jgi:FAD/FMN-containing dehydrogenase
MTFGTNIRVMPQAVLRPLTVAEVSALVKFAAEHNISLVPQAGNTALVNGAIAESATQRAMMWRIREGQSESASKHSYVLRSDVAVAIAKVPALLNWLETRKTKLALRNIRMLPFGLVGDGNLHVNFLIASNQVANLHDELLDALHDEVTRRDGSVSAEHGVGREKLKAVTQRKSATELVLSQNLKALLDPQNIPYPGVVLGIGAFATIAPLPTRRVRSSPDGPALASSLNNSGFNLGNAGGTLISKGLPLPTLASDAVDNSDKSPR